MWGNKASSTALVSKATSSTPRTWNWADHEDDTFFSQSDSRHTSLDTSFDDTPSSPGYTTLAGVEVSRRLSRKPSLEGDPVESAIAEWEVGNVSDGSSEGDDSFVSAATIHTSFEEEPSLSLKKEDPDFDPDFDSRPRKTKLKRLTLPSLPKPRSVALALTRISSETVFHHRFLQCEDHLHTLSVEYLRSKRQGQPWTQPRMMDHALFDWGFVSRKSGLPKESTIESVSDGARESAGRRPQRWTQTDDRLILYLKEIEGLTWKESALMIRYRHSWQAVQMRYLRTLCRLTEQWSKKDTEKLQTIISRDWAGRWKRIATEMGPQFPVERCYRQMKELAGMKVDLERLDEVEDMEDEDVQVDKVVKGYSTWQ